MTRERVALRCRTCGVGVAFVRPPELSPVAVAMMGPALAAFGVPPVDTHARGSVFGIPPAQLSELLELECLVCDLNRQEAEALERERGKASEVSGD